MDPSCTTADHQPPRPIQLFTITHTYTTHLHSSCTVFKENVQTPQLDQLETHSMIGLVPSAGGYHLHHIHLPPQPGVDTQDRFCLVIDTSVIQVINLLNLLNLRWSHICILLHAHAASCSSLLLRTEFCIQKSFKCRVIDNATNL